jgi:hypothetical protein
LPLSAASSEQNTQVVNDSGTEEEEPETETMNTVGQFIISLIALAGGLVTVTIGLVTYRQNQTLKKKDIMKDIITPLIEEYDSPKFKVATDLLDKKGGPVDLFNGEKRKSTIDAEILTKPNLRNKQSEKENLKLKDIANLKEKEVGKKVI